MRSRFPPVALVLVLVVAVSSGPTTTGRPDLGAYAGPGAKAVSGARAFAAWAGRPVTHVLDFLPAANWSDITRPIWLIGPHAATGAARLVLSVPLVPDAPAATLGGCAAGLYNDRWTTLAGNLVTHGLGDTVLRPGWEFNGNWYRWSAGGARDSFAGCFRQFVASARSVPGQHFLFDWNPNLGPGDFPAEEAYPGDGYVDHIGVDVYDVSWTDYPPPPGTTLQSARERVWNRILAGDHGLLFWSGFARTHRKGLSIPEWAVTWRSDGHGGGDNPDFVDEMLDFIADPAHRVVYANYFNSADTPDLAHSLTGPDTRFPTAGAEFRLRMTW